MSERRRGEQIHAVRDGVRFHAGEKSVAGPELIGQLVVIGKVSPIVVAHRSRALRVDARRDRGLGGVHEAVHLAAVHVVVALVPRRRQVVGTNGFVVVRAHRDSRRGLRNEVQRHTIHVTALSFVHAILSEPPKIVVERSVLLRHKKDMLQAGKPGRRWRGAAHGDVHRGSEHRVGVVGRLYRQAACPRSHGDGCIEPRLVSNVVGTDAVNKDLH